MYSKELIPPLTLGLVLPSNPRVNTPLTLGLVPFLTIPLRDLDDLKFVTKDGNLNAASSNNSDIGDN